MSIDTVTLSLDRAIATLLLDQSVAPDIALQFGINLFVGPIRAMSLQASTAPKMPGRAVFVLTSGGQAPVTDHDGNVERTSAVQIWVRGPRSDFESGQLMARQVWDAVHNKRPDNFMVVECNESEPHYIGSPEDHHTWMVAVRVQYWT